ncbi:tRNA lysidine(34) synthetase TilS [endosymbiont of unidentified scaly snail isolate Monju]|uniref:tRNA lysidine(34) synthetase TilS n=1 Tax=endosymbiont of unidentified scaly snail isolate Monju TaxID=1248727 RepID=UPI0003891A8B|nr:tRNA lysidine(34) synthetase TilS [endosymbiont of unidentified scaly snail isolate Monju]BAN69331.1 tRNA(Ile)-lysidine synthase [endosymbiont of unidentified scaly snail isolate Monju]
MGFDPEALLYRLSPLPAPTGWLIAFSGGLDSSVLLHAAAALRERLAGPLRAVHVHHGLQPEADQWAAHCRTVCARLEVPLEVLHLHLEIPAGESPEAAARAARYRAIAGVLRPGEMLLLAQHRDDQAETLLLQLLRGAGVAGLTGMPRCRRWASGWQARPLLDFSRAALRQWAETRGLDWIEDPSNADLRFDRNFLRHRVLPLLRERWPGADKALARSAALLGETRDLLDDCVAGALAGCRAGSGLSVAALRELAVPMRAEVVRAWLRDGGWPLPDQGRLQTIDRQLIESEAGTAPQVAWADVSLRRYRGCLYAVPNPLPAPPTGERVWPAPTPLDLGPGRGRLLALPAARGIPVHCWEAGRVRVRWGESGWRCRPPGRRGHRSARKLYQELGVPAWVRPHVPLIFVDERLVAVGGFSLCELPLARPGEICYRPAWREAVVWPPTGEEDDGIS